MAQDPFGQRDYFALWPYRPAQNFPRNAGGGWGTHYQGHQGQSHHQHYRHHHQHQHHHEHGRKRQRPSQDVPSLSDLRSANTAATRKHYRGKRGSWERNFAPPASYQQPVSQKWSSLETGSFGAPSPWISNAPAAPDNRSGFLLAAPTPLQGGLQLWTRWWCVRHSKGRFLALHASAHAASALLHCQLLDCGCSLASKPREVCRSM